MKKTGRGLKAAVALMVVAVLGSLGIAVVSARPSTVDLGPLITVTEAPSPHNAPLAAGGDPSGTEAAPSVPSPDADAPGPGPSPMDAADAGQAAHDGPAASRVRISSRPAPETTAPAPSPPAPAPTSAAPGAGSAEPAVPGGTTGSGGFTGTTGSGGSTGSTGSGTAPVPPVTAPAPAPTPTPRTVPAPAPQPPVDDDDDGDDDEEDDGGDDEWDDDGDDDD